MHTAVWVLRMQTAPAASLMTCHIVASATVRTARHILCFSVCVFVLSCRRMLYGRTGSTL